MIQRYIRFIDGKFAGFFETELKQVKTKKGKKEIIIYKPVTPYPDSYVLITDQEHQQYHETLNQQENGLLLHDLSMVDGKIVVIDKYSEEEKAAIYKSRNQKIARKLLEINEYRWTNQIKWNEYTEEQKQKITAYYKALVTVVNGESDNLPGDINDNTKQ